MPQAVLWKDIFLGKREKVVESLKNNKNLLSVVDFNVNKLKMWVLIERDLLLFFMLVM